MRLHILLMLSDESKEWEEPNKHYAGQETNFGLKISSEEAM